MQRKENGPMNEADREREGRSQCEKEERDMVIKMEHSPRQASD